MDASGESHPRPAFSSHHHPLLGEQALVSAMGPDGSLSPSSAPLPYGVRSMDEWLDCLATLVADERTAPKWSVPITISSGGWGRVSRPCVLSD